MRTSAWLAAALGVLLAVAARPADAAITAQIPPECGSLADFEAELEQRLGSVDAAQTTHVTLTAEESGYLLVVEAADQRRELHDASCPELLHAAIVVALALLEPKRAEAAPPAPEPTPEPTPLTPPPKAEATAAPRWRPKIALGAGGGVHLGTLPSATLMLDIDAQLKWTRFGVAIGFRYLLPRETQDENGKGARIAASGASLAGLFEPWRRVQTRLGVNAYRLSGSGIGSTQTGDGAAWEVAPSLGAAFVPFQRAPFWTCVGLEGQLNLIRPTFEILSYNEVFQVPLLSGSAFVHAGVVF